MNNPSIASERIMLTGGAGFLGSFVAEKLKAMPVPHKRYAYQAAKAMPVPHKRYAHQAAKARGCKDIVIPKEQDYDLTKAAAIEAAFKDAGRLFSTVPNPQPISPSFRTPRPPRLSGELPSSSSRPPIDIVIHLAAKVGGHWEVLSQ